MFHFELFVLGRDELRGLDESMKLNEHIIKMNFNIPSSEILELKTSCENDSMVLAL